MTTLEDARRIARRVFGGTHPHTTGIDGALQNARAALRARDAPEVLQTADDLAAHFDSL